MDTVWALRWCNAHEAQRVTEADEPEGKPGQACSGPAGCQAAPLSGDVTVFPSFPPIYQSCLRSLSWRRARYKQRLLFWVILWKNELSCFSPVFANTLANSRSTCIYRNCDLRSSSSKGCRFPPHDNSSCLSHQSYPPPVETQTYLSSLCYLSLTTAFAWYLVCPHHASGRS